MATWANDALEAKLPKAKTKASSDYLNFDSDSNSDSGQESEEEPAREDPEGECESRECCAFWPLPGLGLMGTSTIYLAQTYKGQFV